ncbi:WD40 repeat protein [Isoptericola jiangsuensis]|uniref:WD40 repeat protein n=1 Tax=Isoptericola jiangsuensis TaxID=548579 RepID=A0A2A9EW18_9MICO|nr:PD40 domain-containing protein [Isoptericola jiangsuensis]PFG42943.1 WD40 repeat protein [Isoptericola jiangsuensis]
MTRTGRTRRIAAAVSGVALALAGLLPASGATAGNGADDRGHRSPGVTTQLAWTRFIDDDRSGARIVVGDQDGRHVREITSSPSGVYDLNPQISPDGRWIAFERVTPTSYGLVLVRSDGSREEPLDLGCTWPCDAEFVPMWDTDGHHLFFSRAYGPYDEHGNAAAAPLFRADLRTLEVERVSSPDIDGVHEDAMVSVTPDGATLVFLRLGPPLRPGGPPSVAVHRMNRDGSDLRRLTPWELGGDHPKMSPARSGPGKGLVVFETHGTGDAPEGEVPVVATVPVDCRPVAQCERRIRYLTSPTAAPIVYLNPDWSPDGRRIVAFRSDRSTGAADLWTMRWDGRDKRRLTTSPLFEMRPDWGAAPSRP